jgi:hypothetical protein
MKYTSDGKKVAVIGKLNATETIVQEIYVREDGSEIPSGEHFTVKSLHDEPVETWREKQIKAIGRRYEQEQKALVEITERVRRAQRDARVRIKALAVVGTKATAATFQDLEDFVAGKITHVLTGTEYGDCRIWLFEEIIMDHSRTFDCEIKLLSLFGAADGTLRWRINRYKDGSGTDDYVIPARGLDDALRLAQDIYDGRVEKWREGEKTAPPRAENYRGVDGSPIPLLIPKDVTKYWEKRKAKEKAERIARIKAELKKAMAE